MFEALRADDGNERMERVSYTLPLGISLADIVTAVRSSFSTSITSLEDRQSDDANCRKA